MPHRWLSDNEPIYMQHGEKILAPGKRDLSTFIHSGHFFFVFYENASWLNFHFLRRKSQTCRRAAPGIPHYLRLADATLFTRMFAQFIIHSFQVWSCSQGFFSPPLVSKTTRLCSDTRPDNHNGHTTLSWLLFDSTLGTWFEHREWIHKSYNSSVFLCVWPVCVWPVGTKYSWRDLDEGG